MKPDAPSAASSPTKPLDWARSAGQVDSVLAGIAQEVRKRRRRRIAAAGTVLAALLVTVVLWRPSSVPPAATHTIVAVPVRQVLPDGSIIELKDNAQVEVDYQPQLRRVYLRRGEAHFSVAKNKARPFVVSAGGLEVRAVGTAFSVDLGSTAVEVLVTEGRVALEKSAASTSAATESIALGFLDAGNRATLDLAAPVTARAEAISADAMADELSWRVPRLNFNQTPLVEAIPLFNEHAKVHLVLADPSLGQLQLSGLLRADNIDVLLRILESSYGIKAEKHSGEIVLSR